MYAVYGPIITACQGFVEFGAISAAVFVFVYVPMLVAAHVQASLKLLVAAELAYHVAMFLGTFYAVHFRLLPRILNGSYNTDQPAPVTMTPKVSPAPAVTTTGMAPVITDSKVTA